MKKIMLIITVWFFLLNYANAQWQQTNGPFGGTINCMTTAGDTLYAGTDGGVFYTIDNGNNWTKINNGLTDSNIISIAVKGKYLFAGTYDTGGIFISHNNGLIWIHKPFIKAVPRYTTVSSITILDSNIFAGTQYGAGMYMSNDNGTTWKKASTITTASNYTINAIIIKDKNIFASLGFDIYMSEDNGINWTSITNGLFSGITSLAFKDTAIIIGTIGNGIFMTYDYGKNWHPKSSGLIPNINSLTVTKTTIYAGTDDGVYITSDNGNNWNKIGKGFSIFPNILSIIAIDTNIFAGTQYGGVFLLNNKDSTWSRIGSGYKYQKIYAVAANDSNIYAGTQYGGLFRSSNNGDNWISINNGLTRFNSSNNDFIDYTLLVNGNDVFTGTYGSGMFYSDNKGVKWNAYSKGLSYDIRYVAINNIGVKDTTVFICTNGGVYSSSTKYFNWTLLSKDTINTSYTSSIAFNGKNIYIGTTGGIFLSNDNGINWSYKKIKKHFNSAQVISIGLIGTNLFVATEKNGIYIFNDSSTNFIQINNGLNSDTFINALIIKDNNIFVGTWGGGIYLSNNNGISWQPINDGLYNRRIWSLAVNDKYIFAGTDSGGVWRRPLSDIIISIKENVKNNKIYIYPNPTKDKLVIETSDYKNAKAEIININGSTLKELNLKSVKTNIDVSDLNNGLYILKITNDKGVTATKFIKN